MTILRTKEMKEALSRLIEEIWVKRVNSSLNGGKKYLNVS
uniref:Uncharacterized protein n=1 Tax=Rhizophora mucronata TaxID=61149 RepID=A0A2P2JK21_RHIMU